MVACCPCDIASRYLLGAAKQAGRSAGVATGRGLARIHLKGGCQGAWRLVGMTRARALGTHILIAGRLRSLRCRLDAQSFAAMGLCIGRMHMPPSVLTSCKASHIIRLQKLYYSLKDIVCN